MNELLGDKQESAKFLNLFCVNRPHDSLKKIKYNIIQTSDTVPINNRKFISNNLKHLIECKKMKSDFSCSVKNHV